MKLFVALIVPALASLLILTACDDKPATPGGVPSVAPGLTQGPTQFVAVPTPNIPPSPTSRSVVKKGDEVTALEALTQLREDAVKWQKDAQFVMLANVKPGQEGRVLGMALSDPELSDPTPYGKGQNWVLLAASPSTKGVVVLDLAGEKLDLVAQGRVSSFLLDRLTASDQGSALSDLEVSTLMNSDSITTKAAELGAAPGMSMALVAPTRLGLPPLVSKGNSHVPELVYELFAPEPTASVLFLDSKTGAPLSVGTP